MKAYLAGPMTGIEDYNIPLFTAVAELLRDEGFEVVVPHELDEIERIERIEDLSDFGLTPFDRARLLKRDVRFLVECDVIALLPGWETSVGANIEVMTAVLTGMETWEFMEEEQGLVMVHCDARPNLWMLVNHVAEASA